MVILIRYVLLLLVVSMRCSESSVTVCSDKEKNVGHCISKVNIGDCHDNKNGAYMYRNCKQSCGFCPGSSTVIYPLIPGCKDEIAVTQCTGYQKNSFCNHSKYGIYMYLKCKATCNFCRDVRVSSTQPSQQNCGVSLVPQSRIIAGKAAKQGTWPWQAMLNKDNKPSCGAALISNQWIVTAAHCVAGMQNTLHRFEIVLGEHDWTVDEKIEQTFKVSSMIIHPQYRHRQSQDFDIALIKLQHPILPNKYINQVCLPAKGYKVKIGTKCVVTGWGKVTNPGRRHHVLQQATMAIASSSRCQALVKAQNWPFKVTKHMICAGDGGKTDVTTCSGDSGGPLVCPTGLSGAFELHGVVSWGSPSCKAKESYSVFTKVAELRQWIDSTMSTN